jgi:hypothetical protein
MGICPWQATNKRGEAKDDEETLTAFTDMTVQGNMLVVEDTEVVFDDGDGTSVDDDSRDSHTCVSLFGK